MNEPHRPRVKYVIGPDGSPLTIADLPPPTTKRWVIRRKAEVVAGIRVIGIRGERLTVIRYPCADIAGSDGNDAGVCQENRFSRFNRDRLPDMCVRPRQVALRIQRQTEKMERIRILRILRQDPAQQ